MFLRVFACGWVCFRVFANVLVRFLVYGYVCVCLCVCICLRLFACFRVCLREIA